MGFSSGRAQFLGMFPSIVEGNQNPDLQHRAMTTARRKHTLGSHLYFGGEQLALSPRVCAVFRFPTINTDVPPKHTM